MFKKRIGRVEGKGDIEKSNARQEVGMEKARPRQVPARTARTPPKDIALKGRKAYFIFYVRSKMNLR
jgi:hypothetical protein